jgi:protein farnesyltransferase subunit beta
MAARPHSCGDANCSHVHEEHDRISGLDEDPTDETITMPAVPDLFTHLPPIKDELVTATSKIQDETIQECLPWLNLSHIELPQELNSHGLPVLLREKHVKFLKRFEHAYPAPFVAADPTRPWYVYWAMAGLSMLGEDTSYLKDRYICLMF